MGSSLIGRFILTALAAGAIAWAQARPQQGQLDGSETIFTVLAALNAGGYHADWDSPSNSPVRKQLDDALASKHLESMEALKKFFGAHRQEDPIAEFSQYISFALSVGGAPDFQYRMKPEELPPDVQKLEGLNALIARFYREADLGDLWKRAQPRYEDVIAAYHSGVAQALLEANAYLRNATSGFRGRHFQIYVDLLGPPNQIQTRSYGDEYFVVVTPSVEPQIAEVRHAYLHYLLDPLSIRYYEDLDRIKPLAEFAAPAPALDNSYKDDFILLATECVIKAVESRLAPVRERQALVNQAMSEGYVLTAGLADGLVAYEKQEQSMNLYYIDLIHQIDLEREDKRLLNVRFANDTAVKKVKAAPAPPEPVLSGAVKTLAEAEDLYTRRDLDHARESYLKVLEQTPDTTLHAKAYYGLARIAALHNDPELAEKLFQKTLEMSPDAATKSWAYLYLGRLADAAGEREDAERNYRAVLAIDGVPDSVKTAAEKGLAQPFRRGK